MHFVQPKSKSALQSASKLAQLSMPVNVQLRTVQLPVSWHASTSTISSTCISITSLGDHSRITLASPRRLLLGSSLRPFSGR